MKPVALILAAALLLTACGQAPSAPTLRGAGAFAAAGLDKGPILAKPSNGQKKKAVAPPQPEPPRQGLTKQDVTTVATAAYAQAFAAKTPAEATATAKLALEKIKTMIPAKSPVHGVLKFAAKAMAEVEVSDPENARRLALWPLHYLKKGVGGVQDPLFFEMAAMMMESMLNWQDGLALGLVAIEYLEDHPDGYVKTMIAKAQAQFRSPKVTLEDSFKLTMATFKDIQETLETLKK